MARLIHLLLATWFETLAARRRHGPLLPTWGFQFEWVVRFLKRDFADSARWPFERLRADLDARKYPSRALGQVQQERLQLGGVPVLRVTPPNADPRGVLVFFHGGSYIFGSPDKTHADLIARFALGTRRVVVAPAYRLVPEHPYPAALEDAERVFEALAQEQPAGSLVVAGDSAGGHLALSLQLARRDRGQAQARAALLISPWLDLSASRPSCLAHDLYDYGQTPTLLAHARAVAGTRALDDPNLSPLFAPLAGLAPLRVLVGGAERLRDEGLELCERAQQAGVSAEADVVPEMPHNPPTFADFHPACRAGTERCFAWLRAQLERDT